ncbi:MAG: ATP-binding protein [Verrucomicrobiota bacterium]
MKSESSNAPTPADNPVEASAAHKQKLDCALQLARTVALDFNNALTIILGHSSLLLSKMAADNPLRGSLVEIEKSASKAAEIANDLAAFSRQEKEPRAQAAGNINTILQRAVEAFRTPAHAKISWSLQLDRRLFAAFFDEAKIQQAFVKILENAVESIPGEGKISVQTRNLELSAPTQDRTAKLSPGTYVCVEISDTGSGIDAETMPRIFEPFFTTKRASLHRGLGLAWVYGIVTNHGGSVAISSEPGNSTSVRLYLPATTQIVREVAPEIADFRGHQTILFVDDEDLLLTMGQMILSSYGYEVLTANSGKAALEIFSNAKKPIDLIITDLVMPNMSGRELIDQIRQLSPRAKIICSSGYVRAGVNESGEYLQKPFTSQELLRKVKQMLEAD